jgi:NAD(P)-dependent dehydrogenase (short-subunit alcohol dehydrogenase family)|tara:strand:- start:412 stop:1185 length:774 start_codon:yes stop_codon:yes gene_type:complete
MFKKDFKNNNIIITGGAGGIGSATCKLFLDLSANVFLVDNNDRNIKKILKEIKNPKLKCFRVDITKEKEVMRFYKKLHNHAPKINHLINNAGVATLNLCKDLSVKEWDLVMNVNLKGMFLMTKHAIPFLKKGSTILNISSQAARRAQKFTSHYSASKMGVIGFTRAIALELAPDVRVNAISPGTIGTDMINNEINWRIKKGWNKTKKEVEKDWLNRIPLSKYQMPENIAKAIASVCSSQFSETTGETINVSGGAVME